MKRIILFVFVLVWVWKLPAQVSINLKVFLEGPFNGNEMNTGLISLPDFPLNQPYNVSPWNYPGTENILVIPNNDIVDWILIELRETVGGASTATSDKIIHRQAAFLKTGGSVVGLDGMSLITYSGSITGNLFVVVYHRNHLPVMSSAPLILNAGIYSWDFTVLLTNAYLNGHKQLSAGQYGMIGGDCNADNTISMGDAVPEWSSEAGWQGYFQGDVNLNGQVNNPDKNEIWLPNLGRTARLPWECNSPFTDERDNNIYNSIQIGSQCWMAEHLNYGTMIPGSQNQQENTIVEKYCYNDLFSNCEVYGALYQWNEVMAYQNTPGMQGICPESWHIPTDDESETLIIYLGGAAVAGGKLKEEGYTHWDPPNTGATNESGFTALGGGFRTLTGTFQSQKKSTYFWSSTEVNATNTWYRNLDFLYASAGHYNDSKNYGLGLRCIRNTNSAPVQPSDPNPADGAINQPVNATLSWACADPDNDPLTYDIYFGSTNPPPAVASGQPQSTYNPGTLEYNTTFFWKIVVHDDHGNSTEGPVWSFSTGVWTCGDPITDDRDGQLYSTVEIGTQCWMAEDMNIGNMVLGNAGQFNNGVLEKYCYGNDPAYCAIYGGLYLWNEAMQYVTTPGTQGICPDGWHIPADADWNVMVNYLGGPNVAGAAMKEAGLSHWISPNAGATNASGYTGLPGGLWTGGSFINLGMLNYVWSSNEFWDPFYAYDIRLVWNNTTAYLLNDTKLYGFSVRCLMDNEPPTLPSNPQPPDGALNQPVNTTISWSCSDPEGDPLTYDVYFGTTNPPELFATGQTGNSFSPAALGFYTTYYWKIIAADNHNNSIEGPIVSFTTVLSPVWVPGEPFMDERDGQIYETVVIGTQCWMKANLNIGIMIDGNSNQSNNSAIEKYCYENNPSNCAVYGGLYQWNEMMQYNTAQGVQGICPAGWHLPTNDEWCIVETYVDPTISCSTTGWRGVDAGDKLKEAGTTHWAPPNTSATNASGFTGLPSGYRDYGDGSFHHQLSYGYFWTSTENYTHGWARSLGYDYSTIYRFSFDKSFGFSVRCLKD